MVLILAYDGPALCPCGEPARLEIRAGGAEPILFCDPHARQAIAYAHGGAHVN